MFGAPNVAAMLLEQAHVLWISASDISAAFSPTLDGQRQPAEGESGVFDIIQARIAAIMVACAGVEAFANQSIGLAYGNSQYQYVSKTKSGLLESWSLDRIERHMSIDDKMGTVLPEIFKVESPKGHTEWHHFQQLKTLRDRLVHCKIRDILQKSPSDNTIWSPLTAIPFRDPSGDAYNLINYFCSRMPESPRWAAKYPRKQPNKKGKAAK